MTWLVFVFGAVLCWGAYVPMIHHGQMAFDGKSRALWAFLFVGMAYFLVAVLIPVVLLAGRKELASLQQSGPAVRFSIMAGVLGALGALCVILALMKGGKPIYVAPLVFAGAPIVNTIVSTIWSRNVSVPDYRFILGIVLAAVGASLVLRFKPG